MTQLLHSFVTISKPMQSFCSSTAICSGSQHFPSAVTTRIYTVQVFTTAFHTELDATSNSEVPRAPAAAVKREDLQTEKAQTGF